MGCQPNSTSSSKSTAGTGGSTGGSTGGGGTSTGATGGAGGATGGTGGATGGTGGATGGTGGATGGTGGATGGTGGAGPCGGKAAQDATLYDITDPAKIGKGIDVRLTGVIAMSHKMLISYSKSKLQCLWGVFVSAPKTAGGQDITETEAGSGAIVISRGGTGVASKDVCATDPNGKGDAIPDDIAPGDVVNVQGTTDYFLLGGANGCVKATDTDVGAIQLNDACEVSKTGTAKPPTAHVLSAEELTNLATQKNDAGGGVLKFHNQWGGVFVRVAKPTAQLWPGQNGNPDTVVGPFGIFKLGADGAQVQDGLYYVNGSMDTCHVGPKFDEGNPPKPSIQSWDYVEGFHYLNICTWGISPEDKCASTLPASLDCQADKKTTCF